MNCYHYPYGFTKKGQCESCSLRSEWCNDCGVKKSTVFFGHGERCEECADSFKEILYFKQLYDNEQESKKQAIHECGQDDMTCVECCEHEFDMDEGYTCLNCGEQGDYGALIDGARDRMKDDH